MKKTKIVIIIVILFMIVASVGVMFNKRYTIKRKMGIWIPYNSEILNYERNYGYSYKNILMVKISMSKDVYEELSLETSDIYDKKMVRDDISERVNELEEWDSHVCAEDSYLPINTEKEDADWWDLEIENIDEFYYVEKRNPKIGFRSRWIRRIYVVYTDSDIILYLSSWK